MVTVILAFIFFTPRNLFKDSPAYRSQHPNEIVVKSEGSNVFMYEVPASSVTLEGSDVQSALRRALEPLAGSIAITRYETLRDSAGKVTGYRVWGHRS